MIILELRRELKNKDNKIQKKVHISLIKKIIFHKIINRNKTKINNNKKINPKKSKNSIIKIKKLPKIKTFLLNDIYIFISFIL